MRSNVLGIADHSSIVLKIHLRTLFVIDKWKSLKMGLKKFRTKIPAP